jgi:hypothetical protein
MLGYLIDEEEFEVKPAISRVLQVIEVDETRPRRRPNKTQKNPNTFELIFNYPNGILNYVKTLEYVINMGVVKTENVDGWDVYINGDYYGTDIYTIPINTNDELEIIVIKTDNTKESNIFFSCKLL